MMFERITTDPKIFGGKPCVRGLRFPVSRLLGLLAAGQTSEEILAAYSYLEAEDIRGFGFDPLARFFRESDESGSGSRRIKERVFKLPKRTARAASTDQTCRARTSNA